MISSEHANLNLFPTVLLAEDNPIDCETVRRGFAKQRIASSIVEAGVLSFETALFS